MRRLEDAHGAQEREGKINRDEETVSLSFELTDLEDAIEGAVILAECLVSYQLNEDQMIRVPAAIVAALAQVQIRIRQLRRVVRGERDAAEIRTRHNTAVFGPDDDPDILLGAQNRGRGPYNGPGRPGNDRVANAKGAPWEIEISWQGANTSALARTAAPWLAVAEADQGSHDGQEQASGGP
jgi:hypothetical protein